MSRPNKPDGFCQQCVHTLFGDDEPDRQLADLITRDQSDEGLFANVLCEGCGYTMVDSRGRCVSADCYEKHGDY